MSTEVEAAIRYPRNTAIKLPIALGPLGLR
jgi:hypothetical protein